jgi:hypothetical protein
MAEVDDHAGLIHAGDQPTAIGGQATVARLVAAVGESIAFVVGEDRARDTGRLEGIDQIEARVNGVADWKWKATDITPSRRASRISPMVSATLTHAPCGASSRRRKPRRDNASDRAPRFRPRQ